MERVSRSALPDIILTLAVLDAKVLGNLAKRYAYTRQVLCADYRTGISAAPSVARRIR
jgi:hypothetical protein